MVSTLTPDEQLASLKGRLRIKVDTREVTHIPEDIWQKRCGTMSPAELYQRFAAVGGRNDTVLVELELHGQDREPTSVNICHNSAFDADMYDNQITIEWLGDKGTLSWMYFRDEDQNKHLGKKYLRACTELLRAMGTQSMHVMANDMGSYAWAKYGFVPDDGKFITIQNHVADLLKGIDVREMRSFHVKDALTKPERMVLEHLINADVSEQPQLFTQITEMNRVIGRFRGQELTVGKAVLYGTTWAGTLPLKEGDPHYQRFCDYTGIASAKEMGHART